MKKENLLLTGASSGVGASLAVHLGEKYRVIGVARRKEKILELQKQNPQIDLVAVAGDLSVAKNVDSVMNEILNEYGPVSYVINNAGIMTQSKIHELSDEKMLYALQVNGLSTLSILRHVLPGMQKRGFGRVINITSGAPLNCSPGFGAYSASKALLNALTVTAAKENADLDIKINLMSPGPVRSEMAPNGPLEANVCHPTVDYLLNLKKDGPTGKFFWLGYEVPLTPDLTGVNWLEGKGNEKLTKIL